MVSFRTEIEKIPTPFNIDYDDGLLSLGSCFSSNIGEKLNQSKFSICNNPFGVLYNPSSINQSLKMLLSEQPFDEKELVEHNGLWQSFNFHSSFSNSNKQYCVSTIQESLVNAQRQFKNATVLVITFGTSYYFVRNETGNIVANCHKFSASDFTRKQLSISKIIDDYLELIEKHNPELKIIFTLSPIRHLKDGFVENQISKSILRVAINEICKQTSNTHYFPSYEIVLDDLRDYRFYESDLIHPNEIAIDYIWGKFQDCYFGDNTITILKSVAEITKAANHKPFHPNSTKHKSFKKEMLKKVLQLQIEYPKMNWDKEIEVFDD